MQGQLDSRLTEAGISHAQAVGRFLKTHLKHKGSFKIMCSPLGRTAFTAQIIAKYLNYDPTLITQDDRLMEVNLGTWSGHLKSDLKRDLREDYRARRRNLWEYRTPGGESYVDMMARAADWLDNGIDRHQNLIVVSHKVIGKCIRGCYLGLSKDVIMGLPHLHNTIYALRDGRIEAFIAPVDGDSQ